MKVLNLLGGPGTGKSTTRAGLFFKMKLAGHKVEEVSEYAKDLTYEQSWLLLKNQQHVTGEQDRRQRRLIDKVDWAITDSPLPLGLIYAAGTAFDNDHYRNSVWSAFDGYDNVNVLLERVKPYAAYGRSQDEDQARIIDNRIRRLMRDRIDFYIPADEHAPDRIMDVLGLERLAAAA